MLIHCLVNPFSRCDNFPHKIEFRICKQFGSTGPRRPVGGGGNHLEFSFYIQEIRKLIQNEA